MASAERVSPPARLATTLPRRSLMTDSTASPSLNITPRTPIDSCSDCTSSRSTNSNSPLFRSTSVVRTPRAANILAYSTPMIPAPTAITDLGSAFSLRISSESKIDSPSNGTDGGRFGVEPGASTTKAPVTRSSPKREVIAIVWGSRNSACPESSVTAFRPIIQQMASCSRAMTCSTCASTSGMLNPAIAGLAAPGPSTSRAARILRMALLRSFAVIAPLWTHAPPKGSFRSMMATFLPIFAASTAAEQPPGPDPTTITSKSFGGFMGNEAAR